MLTTELVYNKRSGDGVYGKKELVNLITSAGFLCLRTSDIKKWKPRKNNTPDLLIVAGGDGTVRTVVEKLLSRGRKSPPLAILPLGTANNIAKSLKIEGTPEEIIQSWHHGEVKPFDVGTFNGKAEFFIEGFGCGIFPALMKRMMRRKDDDKAQADYALKLALEELRQLITEYTPLECTIATDEETHTGKFLMVEAMNMSHIGPNLKIAPAADVSDGLLELLIVREEERNLLTDFVNNHLEDKPHVAAFKTIRSRKVKISCEGNDFHADDINFKPRKKSFKAGIKKSRLSVLLRVPTEGI